MLSEISFDNNKFNILVEKEGILFKEKYSNKYTIEQIQEKQYFKIFSNPKEILIELQERIEEKTPIINESNNASINLIIFLPISKFRQIEFKLNKENNKITEDSEDLKSIIEKLYEKVEKLEKENLGFKQENKRIFEEYEQIKEKNKNIEFMLEKLSKEKKDKDNESLKKDNFLWINKEVNIISKSDFTSRHPAEIMLGKKVMDKNNDYSLVKGNRNKYIEFSFIKTYFLKSIRIKVKEYECSIETFKVEVISEKGNRDIVGTFIREKYRDNNNFQEFEINKECKGVKLYLIDNWGLGGGNYILISKIDFNVNYYN